MGTSIIIFHFVIKNIILGTNSERFHKHYYIY